MEVAREAVRTWTSRVEELAVQNRAREDAVLLERRARDQVCTCPSRALVQEDIYEAFMARCIEQGKGKFTLGSRCDGP